MGFTLHNLEEAIWLPRWSKLAKKYHEPVESGPFIFAIMVITVIGYILTILDFISGQVGSFANYAYLGFIVLMGINSIFPHLLATIVLKKYAPGLLTGISLNLPLSIIILIQHIKYGLDIYYLIAAIIIVGGIILSSLKPLFRLGKILIDNY